MVPYLPLADTRTLETAWQSASRVPVDAMRVLALPLGAAAATSRPPRGPASSAASRRGQSARAHRSTARDAISATLGVSFSTGARASGRVHRGEGTCTRASSPDDRASASEVSGTGVETTDGVETFSASSETFSADADASRANETKTTTSLSPSQAFRRMWTRADPYHVHGISGGLFTVLGAGVLGFWAKQDVDALVSGTRLAADGVQLWPLASFSLLVAGVCALSGVPLGRLRGWRKTELSARSSLFQAVLTWQALVLGASFAGNFQEGASSTGDLLVTAASVANDSSSSLVTWAFCLAPFVWQTLTSAYILAFTKDDKRSAVLVLIGAWLFGAQVFPVAAVLAQSGGIESLHVNRPELITTWCHSLVGLVWLLNWSTFGASLRARKIVDDLEYRKWFLLRPSLGWIALFALDVGALAPFTSLGEYIATFGGAGLMY